MKVLVTGASGLIGGRLIRDLLDSSDIRVRAASRIERLWPKGVEGCVSDLLRPETLLRACTNVDAVVNLASMAERICAQNREAAMSANGGGARAWASAARAAGVSRFVQVSTYKVYGNNPSGVVTEETPCRPESHYASSHRVAEDLATTEHPNCVVLRLANGFGAPVDAVADCWGIIVNEMCRQAVVEEQITIRSSGRAWRNFIAMGDVVRALLLAITGLPPGLYNTGSPESITLLGVAERVASVCGGTLGFVPAIRAGAAQPGERHELLEFRIDRLRAGGFMPGASPDDELRRTLKVARELFVGNDVG